VNHCICVFCASSNGIAERYFELAKELGEEMARRGHRLVYGGGQNGLMGTVARAVQAGGGHVLGVIPRRPDWAELVFQEANEMIYTSHMRDRKATMELRADAFIALPGGIGTLEELLEIITLRSLGYHQKPIVLLDGRGYYAPLLQMLEKTVAEGFARPGLKEMYHLAETVQDALDYIESHLSPGHP
jgi:uncharacterized protein (TIGR00730 family)